MASTIKVTVTRIKGVAPRQRTHKLIERFPCADTNPSARVLEDCLRQVTRKFIELHGSGSVESTIDVS